MPDSNEVLELDTPAVEGSAAQTEQEPIDSRTEGADNMPPVVEEKPAEEAASQAAAPAATEEQKVPISRLNEITSKRKEIEAERDHWRQMALQAQQQQVQQPVIDAEPKQDDFQEISDYWKAQSEWAGRKAGREAAQQVWQQQQRVQQQVLDNQRAERVQSIMAVNPEFQQSANLVGLAIPYGSSAYNAFIDSANLEQVVTFLAKNPAELIKLAYLPANQQASAVKAIENQLTGNGAASPTVATAPAIRKTTSAPPPPQTLVSGNESATVNLETMSQAEFNAYRNKKAGLY